MFTDDIFKFDITVIQIKDKCWSSFWQWLTFVFKFDPPKYGKILNEKY